MFLLENAIHGLMDTHKVVQMFFNDFIIIITEKYSTPCPPKNIYFIVNVFWGDGEILGVLK